MFTLFLCRLAISVKKVLARFRLNIGSPGDSMCQSTMAYMPRAVAISIRLCTRSVNSLGFVSYPPSWMYIEIRNTSAFQSVASAFSEAVLRHWEYHCRPCDDMPRNWIGWLYLLHSLVPHTCSWPLMSTGVPVPPACVVQVTEPLRVD